MLADRASDFDQTQTIVSVWTRLDLR
jgi:hypothetical protein